MEGLCGRRTPAVATATARGASPCAPRRPAWRSAPGSPAPRNSRPTRAHVRPRARCPPLIARWPVSPHRDRAVAPLFRRWGWHRAGSRGGWEGVFESPRRHGECADARAIREAPSAMGATSVAVRGSWRADGRGIPGHRAGGRAVGCWAPPAVAAARRDRRRVFRGIPPPIVPKHDHTRDVPASRRACRLPTAPPRPRGRRGGRGHTDRAGTAGRARVAGPAVPKPRAAPTGLLGLP